MKIVFTGGGSGGHVYPAIALIQKLIKETPSVQILYIGKKGAFEESICLKEGIPFRGLVVDYLHRKKLHKNVRTLSRYLKAKRIVRDCFNTFNPELRSEEHTSELQSRPHLVC